jgi:hypothetical protein
MKNYDKFYAFVKELVADEVLSESIISGHKTIFESEEAIEEGLRETLGAGLLGASLALAPAARAQNVDNLGIDNQDIDKTELTQISKYKETEMEKEAKKAMSDAKTMTIKNMRKELTIRGGDPELEKTKEFATQEYMKLKDTFGQKYAEGFLRSINWEFNEIGGISPLKIIN